MWRRTGGWFHRSTRWWHRCGIGLEGGCIPQLTPNLLTPYPQCPSGHDQKARPRSPAAHETSPDCINSPPDSNKLIDCSDMLIFFNAGSWPCISLAQLSNLHTFRFWLHISPTLVTHTTAPGCAPPHPPRFFGQVVWPCTIIQLSVPA